MIINPAKAKDRPIMLRAGFSKKEIENIYNRMFGKIVLEVDWDD
jgi:hypothetical protein